MDKGTRSGPAARTVGCALIVLVLVALLAAPLVGLLGFRLVHSTPAHVQSVHMPRRIGPHGAIEPPSMLPMGMHGPTGQRAMAPSVVYLGVGLAGFLGLVLLLVLGLVLVGRAARAGNGLSDEDTRLIQEVHRDLGGMEKRIEALETLLLAGSQPGQVQSSSSTGCRAQEGP